MVGSVVFVVNLLENGRLVLNASTFFTRNSEEEERSLGEVDADVEWEQGEALYTGSDEEDGA